MEGKVSWLLVSSSLGMDQWWEDGLVCKVATSSAVAREVVVVLSEVEVEGQVSAGWVGEEVWCKQAASCGKAIPLGDM